MAAPAYKAKDMKGSHAPALANAFVDELKSWWDNVITMQEKLDIINHSYKIKKEENMTKVNKDGL